MFETERIIEWRMCDSAKILFFAEIFNLAHSVYEEFLLRNSEQDYFEDEKFAIPLINANADFQNPIHLHEILKIKLSVIKIGETSFSLKYLFSNLDDEPKAEVTTSHVFIDKATFEKSNIPEDFLELLIKYKN